MDEIINKQRRLNEILDKTNGLLVYKEQIITIFEQVVGFTKEDSVKMYEAYTHKVGMDHVVGIIKLKLSEDGEELINNVLNLLNNSNNFKSYYIENLNVKMSKTALTEILNNSDGKLKYLFQLELICKYILGIKESNIEEFVKNIIDYSKDTLSKDAIYFNSKLDSLLENRYGNNDFILELKDLIRQNNIELEEKEMHSVYSF